jgi:primosomal protein N'
MKTKSSKQKALEDLKESDIVIGTKMITTGFDFDNV